MGNLVFPCLPGVAVGRKKAAQWSTIVQTAASLREVRIALATQPIYNFELPYEFLRTPRHFQEFQALLSFINQVQGAFDSWLYSDSTDNYVSNQQIGTGDGTTKSFQLTRTYGAYTESIANPNVVTVQTDPTMWAQDLTTPMYPFWQPTLMWLQGSGLGSFSITNPGGVLTFATAPPAGVPVYWSGFFYYRCRFLADVNEFQEQLPYYYDHQGLQFKGNLGTKI